MIIFKRTPSAKGHWSGRDFNANVSAVVSGLLAKDHKAAAKFAAENDFDSMAESTDPDTGIMSTTYFYGVFGDYDNEAAVNKITGKKTAKSDLVIELRD